jgi:formylglycine-generating enzyme required for sulfatase activity
MIISRLISIAFQALAMRILSLLPAALIAPLLLISSFGFTLAQEQPALPTGSTFRDGPTFPEMVVVPPGDFMMGPEPGEMERVVNSLDFISASIARRFDREMKPRHAVKITRRFGIGMFDVTKREFLQFTQVTGYSSNSDCHAFVNSRFSSIGSAAWLRPGFRQTDKDPVVCVSWEDAQAYIEWLNKTLATQRNTANQDLYRLPTESEWEFAAGASMISPKWWSGLTNSRSADCDECGSVWDHKGTAPVGSFPPNPLGLYDMLGNVWQWVQDCWHDNYVNAPSDGNAWGDTICGSHVMRGGGWTTASFAIRPSLRSTTRFPTNYVGFRVAKTLP